MYNESHSSNFPVIEILNATHKLIFAVKFKAFNGHIKFELCLYNYTITVYV